MDEKKPNEKSCIERLETLLLEFVERAVKEGATPEEIAALPEVAQVIANINRY